MPYLKLSSQNTTVDITRCIETISWSENDLDSPDAGRTLDGKMHRGKVTSKNRADIKLLPLKAEVLGPILQVLRFEYFTCETDLMPGYGVISMEMYNSKRSGGILIVDTEGKIRHKDVAFNIIER